jgi:hypothetical protein
LRLSLAFGKRYSRALRGLPAVVREAGAVPWSSQVPWAPVSAGGWSSPAPGGAPASHRVPPAHASRSFFRSFWWRLYSDTNTQWIVMSGKDTKTNYIHIGIVGLGGAVVIFQ